MSILIKFDRFIENKLKNNIMDENIFDTFRIGKKIKVNDDVTVIVMESINEIPTCDGCYFESCCTSNRLDLVGHCDSDFRTDEKDVIFIEVKL